jgi:hypothetical protein
MGKLKGAPLPRVQMKVKGFECSSLPEEWAA